MIIDITRYLAPPKPVSTHVAHYCGFTAITRLFDPADVQRCRRCPTCSACPDGLCLVVTPGTIPPEAAADFVFPSNDSPAQRRIRPSAS